MLFTVLSIAYLRSVVGNGCYAVCAWLPEQNIDLILKGFGHICSPIVMIIRRPRVANE